MNIQAKPHFFVALWLLLTWPPSTLERSIVIYSSEVVTVPAFALTDNCSEKWRGHHAEPMSIHVQWRSVYRRCIDYQNFTFVLTHPW